MQGDNITLSIKRIQRDIFYQILNFFIGMLVVGKDFAPKARQILNHIGSDPTSSHHADGQILYLAPQ